MTYSTPALLSRTCPALIAILGERAPTASLNSSPPTFATRTRAAPMRARPSAYSSHRRARARGGRALRQRSPCSRSLAASGTQAAARLFLIQPGAARRRFANFSFVYVKYLLVVYHLFVEVAHNNSPPHLKDRVSLVLAFPRKINPIAGVSYPILLCPLNRRAFFLKYALPTNFHL